MKLTWNKKKLHKKLPSHNGCSCLFIRLNRRVGLKIYKSKRARNTAYKLQKLAAENKIGPNIGAKFEIHHPSSREATIIKAYTKKSTPYNWNRKCPPFYGYVTQVAQIPSSGISHNEYQQLEAKMERLGMRTGDIGRSHNTGLISGVAVCIDFDPVSMGCEE